MVTSARILIVDDDPRMYRLLARYLGREGYSVRTASNGVEMRRLLATEQPDLIILDLMLPGENGLTLAQELRAQSGVAHENFFPEMKTGYRVRVNNLSHFTNLGCFRCHNGKIVSDKGERREKNCTSCHLIVAQGPSADLDELQRDIRGLPVQHPAPIGGAWQQLDCTRCHTSSSGC